MRQITVRIEQCSAQWSINQNYNEMRNIVSENSPLRGNEITGNE